MLRYVRMSPKLYYLNMYLLLYLVKTVLVEEKLSYWKVEQSVITKCIHSASEELEIENIYLY